MLSEADWSEAVRTAGQQSDDDVHKGDPVGEIRSVTAHTLNHAYKIYYSTNSSAHNHITVLVFFCAASIRKPHNLQPSVPKVFYSS